MVSFDMVGNFLRETPMFFSLVLCLSGWQRDRIWTLMLEQCSGDLWQHSIQPQTQGYETTALLLRVGVLWVRDMNSTRRDDLSAPPFVGPPGKTWMAGVWNHLEASSHTSGWVWSGPLLWFWLAFPWWLIMASFHSVIGRLFIFFGDMSVQVLCPLVNWVVCCCWVVSNDIFPMVFKSPTVRL